MTPVDRARLVLTHLEGLLDKATAGPWEAYYHERDAPAPVVVADWSAVFWPDHDPGDTSTTAQALADCRLAALAPSALALHVETLRELLATMEQGHGGGLPCDGSCPDAKAISAWLRRAETFIGELGIDKTRTAEIDHDVECPHGQRQEVAVEEATSLEKTMREDYEWGQDDGEVYGRYSCWCSACGLAKKVAVEELLEPPP